MDSVSRRRFIKTVAAAGAVAPIAASSAFAQGAGVPFRLCFFSKPLPSMDATRLGRAMKTLGIPGVDLTVRPGGHVDPARVAADLPRFVEGLRREGVDVPMITTALVDATDPAARPTLETAARLKIPCFKPGYYRYQFSSLEQEIAAVDRQLSGLAQLSADLGVQLGYHNHAGFVGGSVLDIAPVIDRLDPQWAGYYFDARHAVVEGGDGGWKLALLRAAPRLKMIAIKDFYWEKTAEGWRQRHCPMGEGMVDWKTFFSMLANTGFRGPASLHIEYDVPGPTAAAREERTLDAAARDLAFVQARLTEAYGGAAARLR